MASPILSFPGDDDDAVRGFVLAEIKAELIELQRLGLITPVVYSRCARYLERHPHEFTDPLVTGPISSADLVDLLLQVAS
jgi:hypothetical protein